MTAEGGDPIALVAAVMAAILFALEAISSKRGFEAGGTPLLAALVVASISIVVYGSLVAVSSTSVPIVTRSVLGIVLFLSAGVLGSGLALIAIYEGVDRVGASITSAVVNSRPLFVALLGVVFLSELLHITTAVGILVLVIGLIAISLSSGGDIRGWRTVEIVVPLGAAAAFAIGNVARRYGLTQTDVPLFEAIAINAIGGLLVLVIYVGIVRGRAVFQAPRRSYGWFVVTGLTASFALLATFFALEREYVAIVESIVATSPLFTLFFTVLLLRDVERITLAVAGGTVLVVLGAIGIVAL